LLENLQRQSDHKTRASRQQIEIDALLRDEDRARSSGTLVDARGLTVREIALFGRLQRRRRDVMRHEMECFQSGQPYASFPQYFYVRGPLNRLFAISGIVKFDASPIRGNKKNVNQTGETTARSTCTANAIKSRPSSCCGTCPIDFHSSR